MTEAGDRPPARPSGSLWRTMRTIAWALFGVRNADRHRQDQESLRPLQVLGMGLLALVLLVLLLMALVNWLV